MLVIFIMNCITFTKINTIKKIHSLDTKKRIKIDYKKLRLSDDYQSPSKEEQEEIEEKKQEEEEEAITDINAFNEQINEEETSINKKIFTKHFKSQRPSELLKGLYKTSDPNKNDIKANLIKSGFKDFKGRN